MYISSQCITPVRMWFQMITPLRIITLCGALLKSSGEHLVSLRGSITLLAALNFGLHLHWWTHSDMFINLFSVSDPHVTVNCGSVWTCQALIRAHVAGFSRILTFKRVCFSMSVTSLLCFHNVHLVRGPSAAQAGEETPWRRWSYHLSLCFVWRNPQQEKQRIIPPASACFPKGQISLCNKAKSFMENPLLFPVLFLILPAVGLKPL